LDVETLRFVANLVVVLLVTPLGFVLWYLMRRTADLAAQNTRELDAFKLHSSETYATKADLVAANVRVERALEHLFEKLDRMDDKLDRRTDPSLVHYRERAPA
jgi:hypothetical protein